MLEIFETTERVLLFGGGDGEEVVVTYMASVCPDDAEKSWGACLVLGMEGWRICNCNVFQVGKDGVRIRETSCVHRRCC